MHHAAASTRFRAGPTILSMSTRSRIAAGGACLAWCLATGSARAADEWTAAPAATDHALPSFALGIGGAYLDYGEKVSPGKSTESGFMPGGQLAAAATFPDRVLLRASVALAAGSLHYDGTTQNLLPIAGNHSSVLVDPELDAGYRFTRGDQVRVAFYVGVGFHYWRRDLSGLPSGGYLEEYTWWQAPIGLVIDNGTAHGFTFGVDGALVPSFSGNIKARLSDASPLLADTELPTGDAVGARIAVPLSWRVGSVRLFVSPAYRYIPLDAGAAVILYDSSGNPVTAAREPESHAHLLTLDVGIGL